MARARKVEGLEIGWSEKGSFPIRISENLFDVENLTVAETIREATGSERPRVMLVADANVVQRTDGLGTRIGKYVRTHGIELAGAPVVLGGGEKIKTDNLQSVLRIVAAALEAKLGASDAMLVLGGGSLLDVAGYAAAQVRGGVRLVRVPTTVAAMADGALSETVAVNGADAKDALRLACRPAAVLVDPTFARTVLDGVWRGGLGELVRQAAVQDAPLMKKLAKNAEALRGRDEALLGGAIRDSLATRAKKGPTDFALWGAFRLEAMSGYKLPHGYAVPLAVCLDCGYAVEKGLMEEADQELVCKTLADCGALDGLSHSQHLLSQTEGILRGLEDWRLATGTEHVVMPAGVGKSTVEEALDRDAFVKVAKAFLAVSKES